MKDIQIFYSGPASTPDTIFLLDSRHNTVIEKINIPGKTGRSIRRNFKRLRAVLNLKRDYIIACEQSNLDMAVRAKKDLERINEQPPALYYFNFYPLGSLMSKDFIKTENIWFARVDSATNYANSFTNVTIQYSEKPIQEIKDPVFT